MAIKQAGVLGSGSNAIKLSILREDLAIKFFNVDNKTLLESVFPFVTNVSANYHTQFYINIGDDISSKIYPMSDISPKTNIILLKNNTIFFNGAGYALHEGYIGGSGQYAKAYLSSRGFNVYYRNSQSNEKIMSGVGPQTVLKYITTTGLETKLPVLLSLVYDDETEEAVLIMCSYSNMNNYSKPTFIFGFVKLNDNFSNRTNFTKKDMYNMIKGEIREYDTDPWSGAGYSEIGGGDGTFDFKSDVIDLPDLPSIDAVSSGFLQLFTGGLSSILELSRYMWSTNFFDNIVKITSNPIDIIMGLYMYPFTVPATNQKYIRAGNVITNIKMFVPNSQIFEIDCGSVDIPNFYGAYLDYEPFTKCDLFLPYCGTFPLSMDDIAGKTINVKYRIDLLTGVCGAYVVIDGTVRYNFVGTCAINIPISSRSFENVYSSIMGIVGSMHGGSSFGLPSVGSVAGAVTSGKNQIQHGGNCSGNAGYLGVQNPYLIFSVPRVAIPKGQNKYTGYPIFATYKLADLKGYTEIEQIHLENMGQATQEEIDKIINMLEGGVIL